MELNKDEQYLLKWLSREDTSQYGECHGKALDHLFELGLAVLHGVESEYDNTFIAKRRGPNPDIMFRAVSLTEEGYAVAKQLWKENPDA